MRQQVRVIKTQAEYDAAIARLSALMDEDIAPGSSKEAELELWALVIEAYERSKISPVAPDPIEAILFRMDQQGMSKKDLLPYFGSLPEVTDVLARKRPLSLAMIRKIRKGLDIPADILLAGADDEEFDLSDEPRYDYAKFPWQEMLDRGYFGNFTGSVRQARDVGEALIRGFMQSIAGEAEAPVLLRAPLHKSGAWAMDDYALLVWRAAVLKKARQQRQKLGVTYRKGAITDGWLRGLATLSRLEQGPRLAQEYLANIGIVMVIEEHFKKACLDGAAMLDDTTPVIALTLRHDRLDNFWFVLAHELVHVQKHLDAAHLFIADNLDDKSRLSNEELEADAGAREAFIPRAEWEKADVKIAPSFVRAIALADRLSIHPSIVAGRVRAEADNWRLLIGFKADVRRHFKDQLGVTVGRNGMPGSVDTALSPDRAGQHSQ